MILPLIVALTQFGVWEWAGKDHNPVILNYFKSIGQGWVKDDETAWCAAFVNWCLLVSGMSFTGKLNARSFLEWGTPIDSPLLGDIVILWRESRSSALGHVGFFIAKDRDYIFILGGNQGDQVNITKYPISRVLGYRRQ